MGMDYSYMLFFKRESRFEVLDRLAEMADLNLEKQTLLIFPDRVMRLPFEAWLETEARLAWDDPSPRWEFMTVLRFETDEEIRYYLQHGGRGGGWEGELPLDNLGRVGIGYIYLTVYNDIRKFIEKAEDADLVLFQFGTPGSSMSVLFSESNSIRRAFLDLLEACQGVYGIFDMENEAEVIWWKGQEMAVRIPHAYLLMEEIESILGGYQ
jgi:hypothetical protein